MEDHSEGIILNTADELIVIGQAFSEKLEDQLEENRSPGGIKF
jgi:hypothetical protein